METLIAEDLLLLLLDDDAGTLKHSDEIQPLLGGALLIELAVAERIEVADQVVDGGDLPARDQEAGQGDRRRRVGSQGRQGRSGGRSGCHVRGAPRRHQRRRHRGKLIS